MKTGVEFIAEERKRQIEMEGWTPEHDDRHGEGELAQAGAVYALKAKSRFYAQAWPWDREWFKPCPQDRIHELAKAGALIAAEIDRLQRRKPIIHNSPECYHSTFRSGFLESHSLISLSSSI